MKEIPHLPSFIQFSFYFVSAKNKKLRVNHLRLRGFTIQKTKYCKKLCLIEMVESSDHCKLHLLLHSDFLFHHFLSNTHLKTEQSSPFNSPSQTSLHIATICSRIKNFSVQALNYIAILDIV